MKSNIILDIKEVLEYKEMLFSLVSRELRSRYKGSFLGFLWTFLTPFLQILVYTLVFTQIFPSNIDNYTVFLIVGLLPWNCFVSILTSATSSVVVNSNLVTKIYFPRIILPISKLLTFTIDYLYSLLILVGVIFLSNVGFSIHILWFPIILAIQSIFSLGLALLLSAGYVKVRDLMYIVNVFTMLWFYLTPVLFDLSNISGVFGKILALNPMAPIIIAYRSIFIVHQVPDMASLIYATIVSCVFCVIGIKVFKKSERSFAEEL